MRIEQAIAVTATDTVGPTRLRLLTAGSSKLPVVVVAAGDADPEYYVLDVAALQSALINQLSATPILDALDLDSRAPRPAVSKQAAATGDPGSPVVENGRLIGVIALDIPERTEPTEADMSRGDSSQAGSGKVASSKAASSKADPRAEPDNGRKRGLWQRLSRSGG